LEEDYSIQGYDRLWPINFLYKGPPEFHGTFAGYLAEDYLMFR
jgi:hypothetical protein